MGLSSTNLDSQVTSTVNAYKEVINISDYESKMIESAVRSARVSAASTKLQLTESIDNFIKLKSDLSYIKLKLNEEYLKTKVPYRNEYDKQFTLLTKMMRPSRQAIESEMHYQSNTLRDYRDKLDKITQLIEFTSTLSDILDRKMNNLESRRYDL